MQNEPVVLIPAMSNQEGSVIPDLLGVGLTVSKFIEKGSS
jgi:hypothetical protein